MVLRPGPSSRRTGFTLVELLLAVSLLVLLLGAIVFNISGLQQGRALDEGAAQLEALFRFVRAEASASGRELQIRFDEEESGDLWWPQASLRVVWEPDPLEQPGVFQPLPEAAEWVKRIAALISIQEVHAPAEGVVPDAGTNSPALVAQDEGLDALLFPPIGFHPDGSSDSAEILLASRDDQDARQVVIRLFGITGAMRRSILAPPSAVPTEAPEHPTNAPAAAGETL